MVNAIAHISFSLNIPKERVAQILKNAEIEDTDENYEIAYEAVQLWAEDRWAEQLDLMTNGEPEVEITA